MFFRCLNDGSVYLDREEDVSKCLTTSSEFSSCGGKSKIFRAFIFVAFMIGCDRRSDVGLPAEKRVEPGVVATVSKLPADLEYGPLGLNDRFDIESWRDGTAFVTAYERIVGDAVIPDKLASDEVANLAQRLATGPNATGIANGIGATLRIAETGTLKLGTEATGLAKAMATGASRYTFDGKKKPTHPTQVEWKQIMVSGGVEERAAIAFLRQPAANIQTVKEKRLDVFARLLQGELQVVPLLRTEYKLALVRSLSEDLRPLADELAQQAAVALLTSISPNKLHEPEGVAEVLAAAMRARKVPEEKIDLKVLRVIAADGYGSVNQYIRARPGYSHYRSAAGFILMHHKVILDEALKECE